MRVSTQPCVNTTVASPRGEYPVNWPGHSCPSSLEEEKLGAQPRRCPGLAAGFHVKEKQKVMFQNICIQEMGREMF